MKKLAIFIIIFVIGSFGGIFGDRILFSYLAGKPPFSEWHFIQEGGRGTTIINRTEEIVVRENERLSEVVMRSIPLIVGVRSMSGDMIYQGTGFILTNDGLIATSGDLLLANALYEVILDGTRFTATLEKRDSASGVAILKIDAGDLPIATFYEGEVKLGELVFLLGAEIEKGELIPYVETGVVRKKAQDSFDTTIDRLLFAASGSPIFNLDRNVVGLTLVRKGIVSVVPIGTVKEVLELAIQ